MELWFVLGLVVCNYAQFTVITCIACMCNIQQGYCKNKVLLK